MILNGVDSERLADSLYFCQLKHPSEALQRQVVAANYLNLQFID